MRTLFSAMLTLGLLIVCALQSAAPPVEPPPAQVARPAAPLELVLLGDNKLSRVQLLIEVDGKPLSAIWDETFARLFAFCDRNGDGFLDMKEATNLPSSIALRQAMGNGFTPPVRAAPPFADLDKNGDGRVSLEELAGYYHRAGLGNTLIGVGRLPHSAELTDSLLKHLDTDANGKVSEKEWKAAAETLAKLDRNEDELIGAGELVPKAVYPGAAGTTLLTAPSADVATPDVLARFPVILLPTDSHDTEWAAEIMRRRDRDGDGRLSLAETGFDKALFKRLDTDKDGQLTIAELAAWRQLEPDARWVVRLGGKAAESNRVAFAGKQLRVEGWATEGKMTDMVAAARRQLTAQFNAPDDAEDSTTPGRRRSGGLSWLTPIADRDGDGKLDRKELDAWFDLQEQIARGQVLVTLLDGGTGLFEILDTNHDGALSVRELRASWDRLKETGCLNDGNFDRANLPQVLLLAVSRGYPKTLATDGRRGPEWFRAMDRNGDGDVSRREWLGSEEEFRKLDTNGDGLISPEEAERAVRPPTTPKAP